VNAWTGRDFTLSPYILLAIILRYVYAQGLRYAAFSKENSGISDWLNELIWREFYSHVWRFPK
jgi:deoxyribodipyrimidine photolyase